jgi:hypothetical protein
MNSQSRSKQNVRGPKSQVRGAKGSRRAPVKSTDTPILAIVVGAILAIVFIGLLIYGAINSRTNPVPTVAGSTGSIPCDQLEHTQVHYHAAIQIVAQGSVHPIPGGIGIQGGENTPSCFYWLHVHSANPNVIHIESTADRVFTLGDFFKVWDAWSTYNNGPHELLDSTHVSTLTVGSGQSLIVYIDLGDGKGAQLFEGDPSTIVLKSHEIVTIEITPPIVTPPPAFDWKSSANSRL